MKKCSGCARAIVESATACDYCGHQAVDPIVDVPGADDVRHEEPFHLDLAPDTSTPQVPPPDPTAQADGFCVDQADPIDFLQLFNDWSAEDVPQLDATPDGSTAQAPPLDSIPEAVGSGLEEPGAIAYLPEFDDQSAVDEPQLDAAPEDTTIQAVPPVPAAQALGSRVGPREVVTGLIGAVGGGIIIVAMLSARGAAAPEPVIMQAPKPVQQEAPAASSPVVTAKWSSNPVTWVGRERNSAAFELQAIDKVQVWLRQVQPMLVVRCRANTTEVFVFTDSAAKMEPQDGNHTVRIRIDEEPEIVERWPDSAEHDALFAPDGAAFARRLVGATKLHFGFSPHNSLPAVASFDVAGLEEHLASSARQCGWTAQPSSPASSRRPAR